MLDKDKIEIAYNHTLPALFVEILLTLHLITRYGNCYRLVTLGIPEVETSVAMPLDNRILIYRVRVVEKKYRASREHSRYEWKRERRSQIDKQIDR